MPWSRRTPMVRSSSFGEVEVQSMNSPLPIMKKKRPGVAVKAASRSKGRNIRPFVQEKGKIKNLNCKLMGTKEGEEDDDIENSILTLGLSNYEVENNDDDNEYVDYSFGVFLKTCSFCKKRIARNMDVFMYGYLKAFCSPECRDAQIEMDESLRPPSPTPAMFSTIAKMVGANKK